MKYLSKIKLERKDVVTFLLIIACLLSYGYFPTKNIFQQVIVSLTFLLIIPALYIKIILKERFYSFGLQFKNNKNNLFWLGACLLTSFLILYILFSQTLFIERYFLPSIIVKSFYFFIFYELVIVLFFSFLYEFFFRGFVLNYFSEKINYWAILLQTILFSFLVINIHPELINWMLMPYLIISPLSGIVAYKSKSIFYSTILTTIFLIILDTLTINYINQFL